MSNPEMDVNDLFAAFQQGSDQGGLCDVKITNGTPPEWNATIIEVGAKFFYRDGSDFTDGPKSVNLGVNDSVILSSDDPSRCVHGVYVLVRVHIPGDDPQLFPHTEQAEKGCLLHVPLTLGKKDPTSDSETLSAVTFPDDLDFRIG